MPSPIRIGMVGGSHDGEHSGFMGRVHRMALRLDGDYILTAGAFSSDPERAERSGRALGIDPERVYTDYTAMAEREAGRDDGIAAVAIVTPNHLHAPIARVFIRAGIHVICEKPLATSLEDALELRALTRDHDVELLLTHNYSGYAAVRQARELVGAGALGEPRIIEADYAQDWLSEAGSEGWRGDPAQAGPAGALGDIGTHAYQLACYVSGLVAIQVSAELHTFVEGRRLDDFAQALLRFDRGARGRLTASQVSPGNDNRLKIAVYGARAGLMFDQESPNDLWFAKHGEPMQRLARGGAGSGPADRYTSRLPAGHPEGYLEAFAQLYRDFAAVLRARAGERAVPAAVLPGVDAGCAGLAFVEAMLASHRRDGRWTAPASIAE